MADSIANTTTTVEFIALNGEIDGAGTMVTEISRPAADGRAFRIVGTKGGEFSLVSIADVASASDAKTLLATYKAMQGTICTITKSGGQAHTYFLCLNVRPLGRRQVAGAVGGLVGGTWIVEAEWTFVYSGT